MRTRPYRQVTRRKLSGRPPPPPLPRRGNLMIVVAVAVFWSARLGHQTRLLGGQHKAKQTMLQQRRQRICGFGERFRVFFFFGRWTMLEDEEEEGD